MISSSFYATESESLRQDIISKLGKVNFNKKLKILDVGGGNNSWLKEFTTDVIDIRPREDLTGITVHVGDAHDDSTWNFPENYFDFISCTHMLEDVRDPQKVLSHISKFGKAGFLAVPNRHSEMSKIESPTWIGNCHHRWIFNVTEEGTFQAFGKWHYINPVAQSRILGNIARILGFFNSRIDFGLKNIFPTVVFNKFDSTLVANYRSKSFPELGILWFQNINLNYFNDDHCGLSPEDSANLMSNFLNQNFYRNTVTKENLLDEIFS